MGGRCACSLERGQVKGRLELHEVRDDGCVRAVGLVGDVPSVCIGQRRAVTGWSNDV